MLNTLANHGFLPRTGRNITREAAMSGLSAALNFDPKFAEQQWEQGVITNPLPNAVFFDLNHLSRHNVLEHDASLSRSDFYLGETNDLFNKTIFEETLSYWPRDTISLQEMANARVGRQLASKISNPTYTFDSDVAESFSIRETISPFLIFGGRESLEIQESWVEYWFSNERLPTQLGFTRPAYASNEEAGLLQDLMANFSKLTTEPSGPAQRKRAVRVDFHGGMRS